MANTIEKVMEVSGTPTLKAIAMVFGVQPVRLYSVAKQPKAGEVYDARVYNWDAIERFVNRRLDADLGLGTVEDVIAAALLKDEELKASDGRTTRGGGSAVKVEKIIVDGKEIQKRKYPNFEIDSEKPFVRRKDANVYKMIFQTASHTVLRPINADGTYASEEMTVISNNMMNYQGVSETNLAQAVTDRFNKVGEFAPAAPVEAVDATEGVDPTSDAKSIHRQK